MDWETHVWQWLVREARLLPGTRLVVGISGGADSVALAHLLLRGGYTLWLAHLDHGLREDSLADAGLVQHLAAMWGLPITVEWADVRGYAEHYGMPIEAAAREVRYRFLFATARRVGAQAVAVAHTMTDQAETVLMHLLRGTGLTGLQGMRPITYIWDPNIPLVRPLLAVPREATRTYCEAHGLPFRDDPTNLDLRFTRNRIRHRLLPVLAQEFNPRIVEALARLARVAQWEMDVLDDLARDAWAKTLVRAETDVLVFRGETFRTLPPGVRAHLWRRAARLLRPARELALEDVERAEAWLAQPRPGPVDWVNGLYLLWEPPHVLVARWEADLPRAHWPQVGNPNQAEPLPLGGQVRLENGWVLEASPPQPVPETWNPKTLSPYEAWLDADALPGPLMVRARRAGDRFAPLGLGGHTVKLSDFMINEKLPRRARSRWPLVVAGGVIVWVPGFRIAHGVHIRPETRQAVHLRLRPPEPIASPV